MKKKTIIGIFFALIGAISVGWNTQKMNVNASETFSGPAPKFSDAPEYLYEFSKPAASISLKNSYNPKFGNGVTSGSPVISGITHSALSGESIVIEGSGLSDAEIYIYGNNKQGSGVYQKAEKISGSDTTVTAIINNEFSNGLLLVWAKNQNGISYPVRVNAPMTTYASDTKLQEGESVRVYGENLILDSSKNVGVYLVKGKTAVQLSVKEANPYCLTVQLPNSVVAGDYKLYVHNGSGQQYGFSTPLSVSVSAKKDVWNGKQITVDGFDAAAIKSAIAIADDYDTIYFPNGTYFVNAQIRVEKKLRFIGESKNGVKLVCGLTAETVGANTNNNHIFLIQGYPSAFSNLTFEDDVDKAYSPIFIWANAYTVNGSREGFTVENCCFGKNQSYGTKTQKKESEVGKCLSISTVTGVRIQNNQFVSPSGAFITESNNIDVSGNTAYGTWINDGENGACFMQFTSCNQIAIYQNKVYGQDIVTDPNGKLDTGDKTFCRVFAFQLPYGATRNVYIADNTFDRVGGFIGNSGELIMFEAIYKLGEFKPSKVSGKTLTFANPTWTSTNGVMKVGTKPILGATVVVCNGKGNAQYRRITGVTSNSVTVDRAWDIQPDNSSVVAIINPMENVVIYRNDITGPENYYTQYNATAGVQAYANMLNFHVKDNKFKNVMTGVRLSSHYYMTGESHFAVFEDTIVEDNIISNVRYGIMMLLVFNNSTDVFQATEPIVHTSHNTIIRGNQISNARYSTASNLNGIGGDGITIGSEYKTYTTWSPTKIYNGAIVKNTVIENNKFSNIANSNIRIQFNQGDTVLRGNSYSGGGVSVAYDISNLSGACTVIPPLEYTGPTSSSEDTVGGTENEEQDETVEGQQPAEDDEIVDKTEESEENTTNKKFNMKYILIGEIILLVAIIIGIVIVILRKYKPRNEEKTK